MKNNLLEIKNLSKIYHSENGELLALKDINIEVKKDEFISIVGPSGCGKSTILSILIGLINKSSGEINYNIEDPIIGYMLQEDSLFPWRTVFENACLGLEIRKELTEENKNYVKNLLKKYGLKEFMDKYPDSLSGGLKQRVG